ncbi:hypothetical protein DL546_000940 [Coniochaeta pulveracea]|uniref:Zn(2)-C6 fungal-type domain-containing protein n=1 Tax=Coniochaeta pulveracea TaxID=177199 RepID=A0A420XZM8_9PEZI|nr:hypothetical protein DL546_000940 [Coniochaeta pulveracea]
MSDTPRNACHSCRRRKLRCNKQRPCSNCQVRSLTCDEQVPEPSASGRKRTHNESDATPNILDRLARVEAYIDLQKNSDRDGSVGHPAHTHNITPEICVPAPGKRVSPSPTASDTNAARHIQEAISQRAVPLGPTSAKDNVLSQALVYNLSISILPVSFLTAQQDINSADIHLPPKHETARLLHVYFEYIGYFQHIIYPPHGLELIDEVYKEISEISDIHGSCTTAPRGLALILAIIALGAILEPIEESFDAVIPILKERLKVTAIYIRASMDCLEQHRRRMTYSLESVQAMLVLYFLMNHIETTSPRARSLLAEAVTVSHSLGLHLLDSASSRTGPTADDLDPMTREMKRRVWWYLAAIDWMSALVEGPFDTIYFVQPNRIWTNLPLNINDDDLDKPHKHERPLSEPTSMSYNLHRLKIAEIARCISDEMPRDANDATCELILSLDSRLESFIQSLPAFFRVEIADSEETARIDRAYPHTPMQRLLINFLVNLMRCKLHFPFLPGHPSRALHAFSQDASLKAARRVLSVYHEMNMTHITHSSDFMKLQGIVFHMFTGALILATNLCCNRPEGQERDRQTSELMEVLRQLDGIKQYSQSASKFLETLTQLLTKYGVWTADTSMAMTLDSAYGTMDMTISQDYLQLAPFPYEELWDTFVERPTALDLF